MEDEGCVECVECVVERDRWGGYVVAEVCECEECECDNREEGCDESSVAVERCEGYEEEEPEPEPVE